MTAHEHRDRWVGRLEKRLLRRGTPRLFMFLLVALTAAAGFFASVTMLEAGLRWMWIRYPLAVVTSYGVFILLLWIWILQRRRVATSGPDPDLLLRRVSHGGPEDVPATGGGSTSGGSGVDLGLEEAVVVLVFVIVVACSTLAAAYVVFTAPSLLAELLLDGVIGVALYRRLRRVDQQHWLQTVWRRTHVPFVATAILFAALGAVFQWYAPEARSVGGVLTRFGAAEHDR